MPDRVACFFWVNYHHILYKSAYLNARFPIKVPPSNKSVSQIRIFLLVAAHKLVFKLEGSDMFGMTSRYWWCFIFKFDTWLYHIRFAEKQRIVTQIYVLLIYVSITCKAFRMVEHYSNSGFHACLLCAWFNKCCPNIRSSQQQPKFMCVSVYKFLHVPPAVQCTRCHIENICRWSRRKFTEIQRTRLLTSILVHSFFVVYILWGVIIDGELSSKLWWRAHM